MFIDVDISIPWYLVVMVVAKGWPASVAPKLDPKLSQSGPPERKHELRFLLSVHFQVPYMTVAMCRSEPESGSLIDSENLPLVLIQGSKEINLFYV